MRKIKEVLRLRSMGLSARQIALSTGVARSTVAEYMRRADAAGVSWPLPDHLDDSTLERLLFGAPQQPKKRSQLDFGYIHTELKKKSVTLALLWEEYIADNPGGYKYSHFCQLYRTFKSKLKLSMRQTHTAGEKMFVDFAGQTVPIIDSYTGAVTPAEIFIAVLGASSYTFAFAVWSQELENWICCHTRAFEYFSGVAHITVPDNLKTGVSRACRFEPDLNPTYADMAGHYGTVVIPTRVAAPKDKAKVEVAVQIVERWILAKLRYHTFFSLAELNQKIAELLKQVNQKPFQKIEGTRKSLYEAIDRPALLPLPKGRYEFARFKVATVGIDYHIDVEGHYHSVPYQLKQEKVDVRVTRSTVEVLFKGKRITSHQKSNKKGHHTTVPEHMPKAHREYADWSPTRLIRWAGTVGPNTAKLVEAIMAARKHPVQGYRSAMGIIRLSRSYPRGRLEAAAERALEARSLSFKSVSLMLKNNLEAAPLGKQQQLPIIEHKNIRGADYYH